MVKAMVIAASLGATAAYGLAQTDSIATLVSNPGKWDGRHVKVVGTVATLEERTSVSGRAYDVFDLCNGTCVRVFMDGHPGLVESQRLTIEGTFSAAKRLDNVQFQNDIQADAE